MAQPGYRKLRPDELAARGLSRTSERYVNTRTGETVSRRQAENARYTAAGWRNRADFERRHNDKTYTWALAQAIVNGKGDRRSLDRVDSQFAKQALRARATRYAKGRAGRSARGPMARLLVYIGLRDPNATYPVGGTP